MVTNVTYLILGISSTFIFTSTLFFCYPHLLHSQHKLKSHLFHQALSGNKLLRISHRGSPRYTTQNTIQAFRKISHISDILQMDVCQTSDHILVIHHDRSLLRTCGINRLLSSLRYQQLPKYQDQIKVDFTTNRHFSTNNEKIPTLESVFQIFQGVTMNIELKTPTESAIKEFMRLIHQYHREDITVVGIRGKESVKIVQHNLQLMKHSNQNQQIKQPLLQFMSDRTVIKVYLAYFLGLLPFIPINQASLQLPIYSKQFQQWFIERGRQNGQSQLKLKLNCKLLKLLNYLSKPLIWHLAKRGIMSYGWVCNTEESRQLAKFMGVHGIMSDQPYELDQFAKKFRDQRNKYQ